MGYPTPAGEVRVQGPGAEAVASLSNLRASLEDLSSKLQVLRRGLHSSEAKIDIPPSPPKNETAGQAAIINHIQIELRIAQEHSRICHALLDSIKELF